MPWLQTHLTVDKTRIELVELLFENLGALSITLGDAGDEPMLEPGPGETPLWQATRITGLFDDSVDPDDLRSRIGLALHTDISRHVKIERLEDRDWERVWLERFRPMRFGRRLWICPTGHQVDAADAVVIDLDPGLAFGTGTHPTTALCLEWLDAQDLDGRTVIDYGCGSGVLAIAALKLGARQAIAVDHDPQALIATQENARRNDVAARLEVVGSDDFTASTADVVLANILANVLVGLSDTIGPLVGPGGQLALSGILHHQMDTVTHAYADTVDFKESKQLDDWVLLTTRRR